MTWTEGPLGHLIRLTAPDEIHNPAAQSHVGVSFQQPEYTGDVAELGVMRLLEAIHGSGVDTRLYQASRSETLGGSPPPQLETTPFVPRSPYAAAKTYAYPLTHNYFHSQRSSGCRPTQHARRPSSAGNRRSPSLSSSTKWSTRILPQWG